MIAAYGLTLMEPTEVVRNIFAPRRLRRSAPACSSNLSKLGFSIQRVFHGRRKRGRDAACRCVGRQHAVLIDLLKIQFHAARLGYDLGIARDFRFGQLNFPGSQLEFKSPLQFVHPNLPYIILDADILHVFRHFDYIIYHESGVAKLLLRPIP